MSGTLWATLTNISIFSRLSYGRPHSLVQSCCYLFPCLWTFLLNRVLSFIRLEVNSIEGRNMRRKCSFRKQKFCAFPSFIYAHMQFPFPQSSPFLVKPADGKIDSHFSFRFLKIIFGCLSFLRVDLEEREFNKDFLWIFKKDAEKFRFKKIKKIAKNHIWFFKLLKSLASSLQCFLVRFFFWTFEDKLQCCNIFCILLMLIFLKASPLKDFPRNETFLLVDA